MGITRFIVAKRLLRNALDPIVTVYVLGERKRIMTTTQTPNEVPNFVLHGLKESGLWC